MRSTYLGMLGLVLSFSLLACGDDDDDMPPDSTTGTDAAMMDSTPPDAARPDATSFECFNGTPACDYFATPDASGACADGKKCVPTDVGPGCENAGAKLAYEACTADSECVTGTFCSMYGAAKACLPLCSSGSCGDAVACPGTDQTCFAVITLRADTRTQIAEVCSKTCDLLEQDCATAGLSCYTAENVPMERGLCADTGTTAVGGTCVASNECVEGSTCIISDSDGMQICRTLCSKADPPDANFPCPDGQTCTNLTGHTTTGFCR